MLILMFSPIIELAERIERCTVRSAPIIQSPFKQGTLRRRWKLRLVEPGLDLS